MKKNPKGIEMLIQVVVVVKESAVPLQIVPVGLLYVANGAFVRLMNSQMEIQMQVNALQSQTAQNGPLRAQNGDTVKQMVAG